MGRQAASHTPAPRLGTIAPITEQIALRLRDKPVLIPVRQAAPLAERHPARVFPVCGADFSSHRVFLDFQPAKSILLVQPASLSRAVERGATETRSRGAFASKLCLILSLEIEGRRSADRRIQPMSAPRS